jgi:Holliday junction DNA helicase RuvA
MIGRLSGTLAYRGEDHALIDVAGVGYIVHCSERTLAALPQPGARVALFTDLVVREDLMQLLGFPTLQEKEWHRLLMGVQGVGAKAALAILGALGPEGLGRAVALGDWGSVKAARGIGPKTAQRVVNELKDKAASVMALGASGLAQADAGAGGAPGAPLVGPAPAPSPTEAEAPRDPVAPPGPTPVTAAAAQAEALSALTHLGYGPTEASGAVARAAAENPDAPTEELIRAALRLLAPGG